MRASKCLTLAAAVVVAAVLVAAPAMAGDYHTGDQLVCSDCHTMHYSLTHTYTDANPPPAGTLSGGPNPRLLKQPENTLCLSCHNSSTTAPDVYGVNTGTDYIRHAGALNGTGGGVPANDAGYDTFTGHTLGSIAAAPGSSPAWSDAAGLSCTDCHSVHNRPAGSLSNNNTDVKGNLHVNNWRNVSRRAGNSATSPNIVISYEVGANTGNYDVSETDATLGQIPTHYDISNMALEEPVPTTSGVSAWCMKCHTNFHAVTSDPNQYNGADWLRHPTADANFTASMDTRFDAFTNHVLVMGSGATSRTPTCTTCHRAHGNKNPFGLIYMSGSGTPSEQGDDGGAGNIRDLCGQCHSQGSM